MVERVPADVEAKYNKFLKLREMLTAVSRERLSLEAMINEIDNVLEELRNLPEDTETYKLVGMVLVKKEKNSVVKELEEKKEDLEIRVKALKNQEEALKNELDKLSRELQRLVSRGPGGPSEAGG